MPGFLCEQRNSTQQFTFYVATHSIVAIGKVSRIKYFPGALSSCNKAISNVAPIFAPNKSTWREKKRSLRAHIEYDLSIVHVIHGNNMARGRLKKYWGEVIRQDM